MPIPDTTIRDGRERPTPRDPPASSRASSRARRRLAPRPRPPRAVGVPARAQNRTQVTSAPSASRSVRGRPAGTPWNPGSSAFQRR